MGINGRRQGNDKPLDRYFRFNEHTRRSRQAVQDHQSTLGENKLRELMDSGELEYIPNGHRRLLADAAIWDWYERAKRKVAPQNQEGGK